MSGVAGADRVKSRNDFKQFLTSYKNLISRFPGFVSLQPSGSYNSNLEKQDFGDIDLIVHITSDKDKAQVKKELQAFLHNQPDTVIVPFSSEKHAGKRSYNAGELVSVRYHDDQLGYSAQIDNIVALDHKEVSFKQQFLDMPAEKQGLVLGLVKIAAIETNPVKLFKSLGINVTEPAGENQEYEFNLSSVKLELRLVTYEPGTFKQVDRKVLWSTQNWDDLQKLLYQYDLNQSFDELLAKSKQIIKNPRSNQRMQGVFASMITVKSGEVGTAKGAGKENALAKVQQTFKETRSLFRALVESDSRKVVFAFGRFQPPTIGHELLINAVQQTAERLGADYVIYVSKTQDKKTNPLSISEKMYFLNKMFPGVHFVACDSVVRTPVEAAKSLNQKYNELVMVAGGDRAPTFEKLLNDYNGKEYNYNGPIKMVTLDRDPDADDATGMSGTRMRQAAVGNDFETFKQGLPTTIGEEDAMKLMNIIRTETVVPTKSKKAPVVQNNEVEEDLLGALALSTALGLGAGSSGMHNTPAPSNQPNVQQAANQKNPISNKYDYSLQKIIRAKTDGSFWKYSKLVLPDNGEGIDGPGINIPGDVIGGMGKDSIPVKLADDGTFYRISGESASTELTPKESQDGGSYAIAKPGYDGESNYTAQPNWRGQNMGEDTNKSMADTAKRLSNKDDGKVAKLRAAGDKKREQQLKYRDTVRRNDEGVAENMYDTVTFGVDSEKAYNHVMAKFGKVISWDGDDMVAPRKYWVAIQQLAHDAGGAAEEAGHEQDVAETKKKAVPSKERDPGALATRQHIVSQEKKHKEWDDRQADFYRRYPEYAPKKEVPLSEDVDMLMASAMAKLLESQLK